VWFSTYPLGVPLLKIHLFCCGLWYLLTAACRTPYKCTYLLTYTSHTTYTHTHTAAVAAMVWSLRIGLVTQKMAWVWCSDSPLQATLSLSASVWLSYLHWLPVHYWIQFKIATFIYKTLATCQPSYLYNLLQAHQPSQALSVLQHRNFSNFSTDFGRHAFSYSSPVTWNSIPTSIKSSFLYSFKRHLKSHLIAQLINN